MTTGARAWRVRLTDAAAADYQSILRWTAETFGRTQARRYAVTLSAALEALTRGPQIVGARSRDEIAPGLYTLHVAREGHKGRHFVMFRIGAQSGRPIIEVLRLLHDAMDLPRHAPPKAE